MTPAALLPPVQSPPHDPRAMAIGPQNAWGDAVFDGLHVDSLSCALTLDASASTRRLLTESNGSFGSASAPSNVAVTSGGDVFLFDRKRSRLLRYDPCCECRFEKIPCLLDAAAVSGITYCNGNLYICDTGNSRLIVLSLKNYAAIAFGKPPVATYASWLPFDAAADQRGRVYVSDPINGCIHRFSSRGAWLGCFDGLGSVTHLAIDCGGRLYAVLQDTRVKVLDLNTGATREQDPTADVRSDFASLPFSVDREGRLIFEPSCTFDPNGDPVTIEETHGPTLLNTGSLTTGALDSRIYRCIWHRVVLVGEIPKDTTIEVASYTSEIELAAPEVKIIFDQQQLTRRVFIRASGGRISDALVLSEPGRYVWLRLTFTGKGFTSPALRYAEIEFPRISLRRFLPAVFGEEAVSADFSDRFLGLFDTTMRSIESKLDNMARYFDPASTPASREGGRIDFLSWLASWVGITFDRQWPEDRRRRFLKQAGKLFPLRGTRKGLWSQLALFLGIPSCATPPLILEHFQLRRWLFVGLGRLHDQSVLWGRRVVNRSQLGSGHAQVDQTQLTMRQDPLRDPFYESAHQFSVFVPARIGKDERDRKGLENLLRAESPAHTKWTIHYVEPRFRIGFQSMIGLDAVVGRYPAGVRLQEATLRNGTVL
jgi:phage tail-like protein